MYTDKIYQDARGFWWVDREGERHGPFPTFDLCVSNIEKFGDWLVDDWAPQYGT
jgi:hypothetical protein